MNPSRLIFSLVFGAVFGASAVCAQAESCKPAVGADHLISAGELQMAINPTLPPQQFVDQQGKLQGLNVELGVAVAKEMCLTPVYIRMDRPPMIPALQAGRFDMINTGLFWTEDRSKIMFMVPYGQQAISVYTSPGSSLKINKFEDLAGLKVGIESGTYQESKSREFNQKMVSAGLKPIDFRTFVNASETTAALRAGQIDAAINTDETAHSLADRGLAKVWISGLYGTDLTLAFRDRATAQAAAVALGRLKADGTYDKLFDKFHMTRLKDVTTFSIRGPGPSSK